jgi:hypothetical protein
MKKISMGLTGFFLFAVVAAFAFAAVTAIAQPSQTVKDDEAQLKADKAALQRQIKRLEDDEARLKENTKEGRMSAESKDAYEVYKAKRAVKGEKKDIAADKAVSLQMKADKAALQRQIKRLDVAEARLKENTKEGRMSAESKDAFKVYEDKQSVKGEKKDITADKAKLKADEKK